MANPRVPGLQPTNPDENCGRTAEHLPQLSCTVLVPVFNDWKAAELLVTQLDAVFADHGLTGQVVLVDDGSADSSPEHFRGIAPKQLHKIEVLELRRNLGHQRALSVGFVYLHQAHIGGVVLVMDADGEDAPSDIPLLLIEFARHKQRKVIFAARGRRAEGLVFKLFYQAYRAIHRALVGLDIRIGNFSAVPTTLLEQLVVASDLWNHYAAAVIKMKLPCAFVPINRSKRVAGQSKMGFVGLVVHGLSAMSVFGDIVGVRLLIASALFGVLTIALAIVTLAVGFATHLAIPAWAAYITGLLLLLLSQCLLLSLVFTFVVLYTRGQSSFIPVRDCPLYIRRVRTVFSKHV